MRRLPYKRLLFKKRNTRFISKLPFPAHCYAPGQAGPGESLKCLAGFSTEASRLDCRSEACKSFSEDGLAAARVGYDLEPYPGEEAGQLASLIN